MVELRESIAGISCFQHQFLRLRLVAGNIFPFEQHDCIFELRRRISVLGGLIVPEGRLLHVARHTEPFRKELGHQGLRGGIADLRAAQRQFHRRQIIAALVGAIGPLGRIDRGIEKRERRIVSRRPEHLSPLGLEIEFLGKRLVLVLVCLISSGSSGFSRLGRVGLCLLRIDRRNDARENRRKSGGRGE